MLLEAKFRKGRLTFPRPIRFKHDEVAVQVVVDDDEIIASEGDSEIEAFLDKLSEEDPFLGELWESISGTIPFVEDDHAENRAYAVETGRAFR